MAFDGKGESMILGDCQRFFRGGDQAQYITCFMVNGLVEANGSIDFNNMTNNVPDEGEDEISVASSSESRPDWAARVFHPNINGMSAYRDAIIEKYNNLIPSATVPLAKERRCLLA
jgi:hypothetical protein